MYETTDHVHGTPRVIYSLWLQGKDNAPSLVRYNWKRWQELNPTYEIRILESEAVDDLLKDTKVDTSTISVQGLSDIVRLRLLMEFGGVWTNASVLPLLPLEDWLPHAVEEIDFFAFERDDVPLSSWFLSSMPESRITTAWWAEVERAWSSPRNASSEPAIPQEPASLVSPEKLEQVNDLPYFWFHCLFQYMLETNPEIRDIWQRRHRLSAGPPHELQTLFATKDTQTDEEIVAAAYCAPVQKLNWRTAYPLERFERLLEEWAHKPSNGNAGSRITRPVD